MQRIRIEKKEILNQEEKLSSESLLSTKNEQAKSKKLLHNQEIKNSIYSISQRNRSFNNKEKSSVREVASLNSAVRLKEKESNNNLDIYSEEFLEHLKFNNLDLKIFSIGRVFLLIGALVLIAIHLMVLVENTTRFDELIKGNLISSIFLERMPKFYELILYYKISVIYSDIYFIRNEDSIEKLHLNYYNVSVDVTKEGIFNSLNESQYSNIYNQFRVIQANIKMFMNDNKDRKMLPNIRILESQLNTKDFCLYLAKAYTELADQFPQGDLFSAFELINKNAHECKFIGNGINNNPLNSILESFLTIINNNYFDFLNSDNKNITRFIGSQEIIRANLQIEYIFKKVHDSIMFYTKSDIDSMYNSNFNNEIFFSTASFLLFIIYTSVFLILVINKLKIFNFNLSYTLRRFNKALFRNKSLLL